MNRWYYVALALLVVAVVGLPPAGAQDGDTTTLRVAVLGPRGSSWHRVFTAWGNSLRTQTGGRLTLRIQSATPGEEDRLVAQLRDGSLDGACLTAVGLGLIAKPTLVLQAPGVFDDDAALDRARTAMDRELRGLLDTHGATLIGWSDFGRARIFASYPVAAPSDLRGHAAWVLPGDPVGPAYFSSLGARAVALPLSGVRGALEAQRVDTVFASASAVSALQWPPLITHVSEGGGAVLVGGTVIAKRRFDALPADLQSALRDTGRQATESLNRMIRREDDRYYQTLTTRQGVTTVSTSAHADAWRQAARRAREGLVGEVYSRELLERTVAAARR